jgi:hypothetical protein
MARAQAVRVELAERGTGAITKKMILWSTRAGDIRPAGPVLAEYLMGVQARQFDSQGASSGHPWSALADATQKTKERKGLRPEIMRATDALRDAFGEPGNENQKILMGKQTFVFGVSGEPAEYGSIHQREGDRKPVDLTALNKRMCVMAISRWITGGVAAMGV